MVVGTTHDCLLCLALYVQRRTLIGRNVKAKVNFTTQVEVIVVTIGPSV